MSPSLLDLGTEQGPCKRVRDRPSGFRPSPNTLAASTVKRICVMILPNLVGTHSRAFLDVGYRGHLTSGKYIYRNEEEDRPPLRSVGSGAA